MSTPPPYDPNQQQWQPPQGYHPPAQNEPGITNGLKIAIGIFIGYVLLTVVAAALIGYVVINALQEQGNRNAASVSASPGDIKAKSSNQITLEKYTRLKPGMTRDEVEKILGEPGELVNSDTKDGKKRETYIWIGPNYGNMSATFSDGKLVSRSQYGLK